jgi:hypothetical protein
MHVIHRDVWGSVAIATLGCGQVLGHYHVLEEEPAEARSETDAAAKEPLFAEVPRYLSTGECRTCLESKCADQWAACQASDACMHRIDCEAGCNDAACADMCRHEARRLLYPTTDDLVDYEHRKLAGDSGVEDVLIPLGKCDETACGTACAADVPDFSCAGRYDPPRLYRRGAPLEVTLAAMGTQANTGQVFPDYLAFGCSTASPDCMPIAPTHADATGVAVIELPALVDEGFTGPLRAELSAVDDNFADLLYSRTLPFFDGYSVRSFPISTEDFRTGCAPLFPPQLLDCEAEDLAGYVATLRDCQRRPAGGLELQYICEADLCVQQPTAYDRGALQLTLEPPSKRDAVFQFIGGVPAEATHRVFVVHGTNHVVAASSVMARGRVGHHEDVFPITRTEVALLRTEPWADRYTWPE